MKKKTAEQLLKELLVASAPYLRRRKFTARRDCDELNRVWDECREKISLAEAQGEG